MHLKVKAPVKMQILETPINNQSSHQDALADRCICADFLSTLLTLVVVHILFGRRTSQFIANSFKRDLLGIAINKLPSER